MDYQHVVKDFASRTKHNLQLIEKARDDGLEAYEVTQLINSCLGLLVLPQQNYMNSIPETPINELVEMGWKIPKVKGDFPQAENLRELMRFLRNAIAHFNIEFTSKDPDHLQAIKVWNKNRGKITWQATFTLTELHSLLEQFINLIEDETQWQK